ncbi:hypothetical protein Tco_1558280 [Tanacetum coccineum]
MVLLVVILSAGRLVSAGRTIVLLLWIMLLIVVYAANTSIHAAALVCAGSFMVLLADLFLLIVTCFCCLNLVSVVLSLILLENRRRKYFTYLKQLLPHVYREDLLLLRRQMNRYFRLNPDVDVGLDLWRDVNMLCQSLHPDDVEEFWRTQDEWIVSSWKLYPKSYVHVLDVASTVSAACIVAAGYIVSAGICDAAGSFVLAVLIYICCLLCFCCYSILLLREDLSRNLELTESKPMVSADCVPAGHVLISADRYRESADLNYRRDYCN